MAYSTSLPCPARGTVVVRTAARRGARPCDCCGAPLRAPTDGLPNLYLSYGSEPAHEVRGGWNGRRSHWLCGRCAAAKCDQRRGEAKAITDVARGEALDIAEALAHRGMLGGLRDCWNPICRRPQCIAARQRERLDARLREPPPLPQDATSSLSS